MSGRGSRRFERGCDQRRNRYSLLFGRGDGCGFWRGKRGIVLGGRGSLLGCLDMRWFPRECLVGNCALGGGWDGRGQRRR